MSINKPELLLPAGNLEKLKVAFMYGGDACYVGLADFSLRSRVNQFTKEDLLEARGLADKLGKKIYVTTNIFPRNEKINNFKEHIEWLRDELKPDAIILADPGVFDLVREVWPEGEIHISVQANNLNWRTVKFWHDLGATRIILARELSLKEMKEIHEKVPEMEIEAFIHGAICISYSGRCLLSAYMTGRDANQGFCAQSCRWKYKVKLPKCSGQICNDSDCGEGDQLTPDNNNMPKLAYLEEELRPDELMPIEEDQHGTYILNSRDMCLIEHLGDLTNAGVISFKVEGRSKSIYYLATIAKVYRKAIDDMAEGRPIDLGLIEELKKVSNRTFIKGFLFEPQTKDTVYYPENASIQTHQFCGVVRSVKGDGWYEFEVRNRIEKGMNVEIFTPDQNLDFVLDEMKTLAGEEIEVASGGIGNILVKLPEGLSELSFVRSLVG
ncbi:U32 family peptidase C-terminal domain-containing protein [Patescibacteria group bacterium]|nr:U32 family peptidase C-terminal domain-containing protein [Patescibacteria group bacterium]